MSRKLTLKAGSSKARGKSGKGGSHVQAVPAYIVVKLAKSGLSPQRIAKKLGCSVEYAKSVLDEREVARG